jgi:predicted neuraminidase
MPPLRPSLPPDGPFIERDSIFPLHPLHNHASCIVECPDGGLLACWYRGAGERRADDVAIYGARWHSGEPGWSEAFVMADTPGFPDTNPCMTVDPRGRLWLFWPTILDNRWESALLKYRRADACGAHGPPDWNRDGVIHLKPGPEFSESVERDLEAAWEPYRRELSPEKAAELPNYLTERRRMASEKLSVRLGWMPRSRPLFLEDRMILPLYSDGFDFSLMAYTDDEGDHWQVSRPIIGAGNVQPTLARRSDGVLVAFFRDNGPPPKRVIQSESYDRGETWSRPADTALRDPGAGVEVVALRSGAWALVHNDTETGRHRLAVSASFDEGRTWPHSRLLEDDPPGAGGYSYPSALQSADGTIHVTYSAAPPRAPGEEERKETIRHVRFSESWFLEKVSAGRAEEKDESGGRGESVT